MSTYKVLFKDQSSLNYNDMSSNMKGSHIKIQPSVFQTSGRKTHSQDSQKTIKRKKPRAPKIKALSNLEALQKECQILKEQQVKLD